MRRISLPLQSLIIGPYALAAILAAAARAGDAPAAEAVADAALEGAFRWTTLDGRHAQLEFPAGSTVTPLAGSPEPRDAVAARDGTGRVSPRFTMRARGDSARTAGEDGRFHTVADSLHFSPDGAEHRPPVRVRYADGVLALTRARGNVWRYVRR